MAGLEGLPTETLLHILAYLEPVDLTTLQLVSRKFRDFVRDNKLWRKRCFDNSTYLEAYNKRIRSHRNISAQINLAGDLHVHASSDQSGSSDGEQDRSQWGNGATPATTVPPTPTPAERERERMRITANWDPVLPGERVSWYEEYIHRQGSVAVNWFQLARKADGLDGPTASSVNFVEARGVALYRPDQRMDGGGGPLETLLAVSPMDDGSVCLWDVNGTRVGRRGAIVDRTKPGILFMDSEADNQSRSRRVDSGFVDCVSVDSFKHQAFFAVQSHLVQVDLQRLSVVNCESFPWAITALSAASPGVPLTVGTTFSVELCDYRLQRPPRSDLNDRLDGDGSRSIDAYKPTLRDVFSDRPLRPHASLSQPRPLSILHLPRPGQNADISDDIYLAGRFSHILHYDRRMFGSIKDSIFSGGQLCGLTAIPYSFSSTDSERRRKGQLSLNQVKRVKEAACDGGRTLIACGEYNSKGSLEMYGLAGNSSLEEESATQSHVSELRNRQTASDSKLLSVVNHGTRIAFSDASGLIKWFERDGVTEVRRHKIGHDEGARGASSMFGSMAGSDDVARKLLPTGGDGAAPSVNANDLVFWTGEKLGMVTFSARPGFKSEDFEEPDGTEADEEALAREREERAYGDRMRRALERQADDVRLVANLGLSGY